MATKPLSTRLPDVAAFAFMALPLILSLVMTLAGEGAGQ